MPNVLYRRLVIGSCMLFFVFSVAACGGQKKSVDPYRDRQKNTYQAQHRKPLSSKSLPEMQAVPDNSDPVSVTKPDNSVPPEQSVTNGALLPVLTLVADRIVAYEEKLLVWDTFSAEAEKASIEEELREKINGCRYGLQEILSNYNNLHEDLIRESSEVSFDSRVMEQAYRVEQSDIHFLESECQQIIQSSQQSDTWIHGTTKRLLEEKETGIADAMAAGNFYQVIDLYEELPPELSEQLSFHTVYSYGQALLRTNSEHDAGLVFQELLRSVQQQNEIDREFELMQLVADIEFGLEEYPSAFDQYVGIINRYAGFGDNIDWARKQQEVISARGHQGIEVRNFATLLLAHITYNPDRDGFKVVDLAERFIESFPDSTVISTANRILFESQDRADAWFATMIQRLNLLADEKNYAGALEFIEKLPMQEMPPDKREYIRGRADELITAQFQAAEFKRLALEASLQETWEKGQNYLRAKDYDAAIEVFSTLIDTDYGDRALSQVQEAANLSASEDRRRAAEFFVRSSNTTDLDTRIRLLFESRQLLLNILIKYPDSDLVDKVRNNLERIEQEINSIDPGLLLNPPDIETEPAVTKEPQAGSGAFNSMNVGELQVQPTSNNWSVQGDESTGTLSVPDETGLQE